VRKLFTRTQLTAFVFGIGMMVAAASQASADIVAEYVSRTAEGANTRFTYTAFVTVTQRVETGDYFTIYDIPGFAGGVMFPANWTFSTQNVGVTPADVNGAAFDDPSVTNITFQYTGAQTIPGGPTNLGTFSFLSTNSGLGVDRYVGRGTNNTDDPGLNGTKNGNIGNINVPAPAAAVPEPGSLALALPGLLPMAGLLFRRRKSS